MTDWTAEQHNAFPPLEIGDLRPEARAFLMGAKLPGHRFAEVDVTTFGDAKQQTRVIRTFATGATRDTDDGKYDYEGFLSPAVLVRFGEYMHKHRTQADGNLRDSDNWQKGITREAYIKSGWRHFMDWWLHHRGISRLTKESLEEALCALMFNVMGYLHEQMKEDV